MVASGNALGLTNNFSLNPEFQPIELSRYEIYLSGSWSLR